MSDPVRRRLSPSLPPSPPPSRPWPRLVYSSRDSTKPSATSKPTPVMATTVRAIEQQLPLLKPAHLLYVANLVRGLADDADERMRREQ